MSGRRGSADEEELRGGSATERYRQHLEGKSSPEDFYLHTEDLLAALRSHPHPYKKTPSRFPHEEQRKHAQAEICLKLAFIPVFHLAYVCPTKRGITHLIQMSGTLKLLDELGH